MNKVSVIVPIFNVAQYLDQCIESCVEQTYKNIEIILVDDGSPDDSGKIADEWASKDSRIKVIHKANAGVSEARNSGLDVATGDWICFSDGDDWLKSNYVEYLLGLALENNADVAVTTDMFTTFYENDSKSNQISLLTGQDAAISILSYNMPIGVYCKMFKRSLLEKIRFEKELFIGEGFNFNTDVFQQSGKVAVGHQKVYYYRRDNDNSAMTKFNIKKVECALYAIQKIESKLVNRTQSIVDAVRFANWHTHCDMLFFMFLANAENEYIDIYKKCKKVARADAFSAFKVPTSFKEKIRAVITWIYPKTIAYLMLWRRNYYSRKK